MINRVRPTFAWQMCDETGKAYRGHRPRVHHHARLVRPAHDLGGDRSARQQAAGERAARHDDRRGAACSSAPSSGCCAATTRSSTSPRYVNEFRPRIAAIQDQLVKILPASMLGVVRVRQAELMEDGIPEAAGAARGQPRRHELGHGHHPHLAHRRRARRRRRRARLLRRRRALQSRPPAQRQTRTSPPRRRGRRPRWPTLVDDLFSYQSVARLARHQRDRRRQRADPVEPGSRSARASSSASTRPCTTSAPRRRSIWPCSPSPAAVAGARGVVAFLSARAAPHPNPLPAPGERGLVLRKYAHDPPEARAAQSPLPATAGRGLG